MRTKDITVSLVIPAYNEERMLSACLDAVAAQTVKPYEVIVVDNNSTDKTAEIARRYSFVTLLHEKRQGRARAQTAGFRTASGTVLARIDADAILPTDWVANVVRYFEQPGALRTAWTGGALFYNVRLPHLASSMYNWVAFRVNALLTGHPSLWGSSMAFPKAAWQEVYAQLCQRSDIHEDLDLSIHLHRAGYQVVYDKHVKVSVELRPVYAGIPVLWEYLKMWPRTLRMHGIKTWPLSWVVNLFLFVGNPFFTLTERTARLFGRKPLNGHLRERRNANP